MPDSYFKSQPGEKQFSILFYFLLIIQLFPIWLFRYFPSSDGPSHLFNSYVYLVHSSVRVFDQVFSLHVPMAGNLAGHALAIFFLRSGVPFEVCEKLIVTICLLGTALAFRYAVKGVQGAHPAASLFVLPLLYNWPLQMGFWSFSLGVPLLLVCIGITLRYRKRWNARRLLLLFVAIAAVYACHPISWAVCGAAVAILLLGSEWRELLHGPNRIRALQRVVVPLLLFVPFAVPNFLFAARNELLVWDPFPGVRKALWPVYTMSSVHLFRSDALAAKMLFAFLALGTVAALWPKVRTRQFNFSDVLLPVTAVLVAIALASPARIGEGTFVQIRLLLFGYLVWALWLGLTLTGRALLSGAALAALMSLALLFVRLPDWKTANRSLEEFVTETGVIPAGSFVCQLNFDGPTDMVLPMDHAVDLLAKKQVVDVRDYEAAREAFWTHFQPGYYLDESYLNPTVPNDLEGALDRFEGRTGHKIDFILLTDIKQPPTRLMAHLLPHLQDRFQMVAAKDPVVAVYRRIR